MRGRDGEGWEGRKEVEKGSVSSVTWFFLTVAAVILQHKN